MAGYTVECLNIDGRWSPKDAQFKLQSLFGVAVDSFAARLSGRRSRIQEWPSGKVVAEVPPLAVHVSPRDIWRLTPALKKLGFK